MVPATANFAPIKDLFENVEAQNIIDFIKKLIFISSFNIFVLIFVIYFYFNSIALILNL